MTNKAKAATAAATDQVGVQTSAPATEETVTAPTTADQVASTASQHAADQGVGDVKDAEEKPVRGRALVDLPAYDLKCGEFGSLPYETARALWASGYFDPRAIEP